MPAYLVSFQQQWADGRPPEWYAERGRLARAVVEELRAAGALVFGGGLVEDDTAVLLEPTGDGVTTTEEPVAGRADRLGGFTVLDAPDDETARAWAARIAEACGWRQELRRFGDGAAW